MGKELDLDNIKSFFDKHYSVKKLWSGGRHILGILGKEDKTLFLKLATTEGISAVTENEYRWNEQFNKLISRKTSNFWVPQNKDCGLYQDKLFYLITDRFNGELLVKEPAKMKIPGTIIKNILSIIGFSELIQKLKINLPNREDPDYQKVFLKKTESWYEDIPDDIKVKYKVVDLLKIVAAHVINLPQKPRHGDFTPWHLIKLQGGQLGLIDGEHAKKNGVEYYDIGYFIQRVFSVLQNPTLAEKILSQLAKRNYSLEKLAVILSARAIGGYLDESLKPTPNYVFSNRFKDWVIKLVT
ncbi:hypothetical protein HYZ05_01840 [Candidatus Daviesbacteria bacterium]|nr:hypothetical protein [Candidatus Daviesbacteria bacterium]